MKKLLILFFFLIIANIMLWFFYIPHKDEVLSKSLSDYKMLRDKKAKERLLSFQDIYEIKDKIGDYEKRLRAKEDFTKIINYIFEKSFMGNVDIKTISYNFEERKELNVTKLALNITVEGKYESIKKFLYELESGSHFIIIDSLKIQKGNDILSGAITIITFLKGIN